ncbi:hypothetical protein P3X46_016462 [Hevea brasiliensis]|uniref:DUF4005 domain-containing protein n=1 Tax=Hevea brasiliensis TaxID=3981 RepID=A0ABQ9LZ93_HEVBR|nr:uncharacterized protein LOC110660846 isoform X2 [Hevea brasiliensis]KAJ9173311.1 hypothetical protein P3X46_016462 [Hevea brasiliensis]
MAKLCLKKAVLVSVYEEKPTKRRVSSTNHRHHHYHPHHRYVHHSIQQERDDDSPTGKGYNRRAELLLYSQRLRHSVRPAESSHLLDPKSTSSTSNILQSAVNAVAVKRKPKDKRTPNCLGNWKILSLKFCRSLTSVQVKKENKKKKHTGSTSNAMKVVMKSLEVQKKRGFISKLLWQKHEK